MHKKDCANCGKTFEHSNPLSIYCGSECSSEGKVKRRYERENNDWQAYYKHLLSKKKGSSLTVAQLVGKTAEQNYKCALSGVELTCYHVRGQVIPTNASLDRINAGKEYNYDNVQIVCRATNNFRADTSVDEYIDWCIKVAFHAIRKQKKTL